MLQMRKLRLFYLLLFMGSSSLLWAQNKTVSGRITDSLNSPLPGVTVTAKGTKLASVTDQNGQFSISVPQNTRTLVFSSVGYESREVNIANTSTVNISLIQSGGNLNEVVITTGYNTIRRSRFAGSAVAVDAEAVRTQPLGSFDQALQGQAPGVSVVGNSGQPGAAGTVRIRGNGSLNGSNTPLYIVDGIEINAADFGTLNQGDFERVEVLKDAVSAGLYGSRGANGVIVITTRKGRAGTLQLNYDMQLGISQLPKDRLLIMNSREKIDYELANGNPFGWTAAQADSLRNVNFNWQDALFRQGSTQQYQISASGGTERTRIYASLSYLNQEGIVRATGLKRYTGRINIDNTLGNLKFGMGLQGGYSIINNTPEVNTNINAPLNAARWSNPYERDKNPNTGDYQQTGGPGRLLSAQPNGAMELFLNKRTFPQVKGIGTVYAEYAFPFLRGLSLRTNWGADYTQNESEVYIDRTTVTGQNNQGANGRLSRGLDRNFRYTGTTSLNYRKEFGEHAVDAGVYYEVVKNQFRTFSYNGYGLTNGFTNEAGITAGTGTNGFIPQVAGNGTANGLLSYFTIINYSFRNRYSLTLTGRRDGSSRFGIDNQFANFGSVGAVWNIEREAFLSGIKLINELRLRASYGSTGNERSPSGDFGHLPLLGRASYNGVNGFAISDPGNTRLRWETGITTNVGLDFAVWNRRVSGTVDFYNRLTENLFVSVPTSVTSGSPLAQGSIPSNFGSLRNRGIELTLRVDVVRNKDFFWTVDGNITKNRNTVLDLQKDSVLQGTTMLKEGLPANSLYLVRYAGVSAADGAPLYYKRDGSITDVYSASDRVFFGTLDAPWFGGFGTSVGYKGLELSVQFNFFKGREVYNNDLSNLMEPTYFTDNLSTLRLQEWRRPGDVTNIPGFAYGFIGTVNNTSFFIEDGSFLRLRNATLRYTFNRKMLEKIKLRSLQVFVQGQNLWTSTQFRGFDPEVVGNLTGAQYPAMVQGTAGISIGF
jgi:TonB-dependent starch-binding outer membrane protein SusC